MRFAGIILIIASIFSIGFSSCTDKIGEGDNLITLEGNVRIHDTLVIEENNALFIKPGAEIIFEPGAIIVAHGNLTIEGTQEQPIRLIAEEPIEDHRIITAQKSCKVFKLRHAEVTDGLITSYNTDNHFQYVTFRNQHKLKWNDAVARFRSGRVLIEDCVVDWNNQGEGFLLHNVQSPLVQNCSFSKVPDAVEYIHCENGYIMGNHFENMNDDAIDQNHCYSTLIKNNTFYNVKDKALELGSEKFGSSDSLSVINNLFVNCQIAINVKESSNVRVENATFYNNKISIDIHTHEDSTRASKAEIYRSVVIKSGLPVSVNPRSIVILKDCLSDEPLPEGTNNIVSVVEFRDPENKDFTILNGELPSGLTTKTIGYQPYK